MNYKHFDLEKALKGEPLLDWDGNLIERYEIFHSKFRDDDYYLEISYDTNFDKLANGNHLFSIMISYFNNNKTIIRHLCTKDGIVDPRDLKKRFYMAPKKSKFKKYWVVVYKNFNYRSETIMSRRFNDEVDKDYFIGTLFNYNNKEEFLGKDIINTHIKTLEFEEEE